MMNSRNTSFTTGAGSSDCSCILNSSITQDTPIDAPGEQKVQFPLPETLSKRQLNLLKRQKKEEIRRAKESLKQIDQVQFEHSKRPANNNDNSSSDDDDDETPNPDLPVGYKPGMFGRQARKLLRSVDKHGLLRPKAHAVIKPEVLRYYQYSSCTRVAKRLADRSAKSRKGTLMT
jgi:hypothetical protein